MRFHAEKTTSLCGVSYHARPTRGSCVAGTSREQQRPNCRNLGERAPALKRLSPKRNGPKEPALCFVLQLGRPADCLPPPRELIANGFLVLSWRLAGGATLNEINANKQADPALDAWLHQRVLVCRARSTAGRLFSLATRSSRQRLARSRWLSSPYQS